MAVLTVFTPAYNRAHTLPRTYESLLNQSIFLFTAVLLTGNPIDFRVQRKWMRIIKIPTMMCWEIGKTRLLLLLEQ